MSDIILYGIKNCDTIKKARKWLADNGVDYRFHDYRVDGVDKAKLVSWCQNVGWETLLNRRGTTWRQLPDAQREGIDEINAVELMLEFPAMIKRPVLEAKRKVLVGFSIENYSELLQLK